MYREAVVGKDCEDGDQDGAHESVAQEEGGEPGATLRPLPRLQKEGQNSVSKDGACLWRCQRPGPMRERDGLVKDVKHTNSVRATMISLV